jgi:hypothetical protein
MMFVVAWGAERARAFTLLAEPIDLALEIKVIANIFFFPQILVLGAQSQIFLLQFNCCFAELHDLFLRLKGCALFQELRDLGIGWKGDHRLSVVIGNLLRLGRVVVTAPDRSSVIHGAKDVQECQEQ